jgi:hypothetical protein
MCFESVASFKKIHPSAFNTSSSQAHRSESLTGTESKSDHTSRKEKPITFDPSHLVELPNLVAKYGGTDSNKFQYSHMGS